MLKEGRKMKKVFWAAVFFVVMLLPTAAGAASPEFSHESGIYNEAISVSITGGENIYYTTDGSLPTESSNKYTGSIKITEQTEVLAQRLNYWQEERLTVPKASVIRAAVFENGQAGEVVSKTYFVGSGVSAFQGSMNIMNLIVTPYDLWDSQNGIYQNFEYEHKVAAELHCIEPSGKMGFELSGIETKVSGHGSRSAAKKSFRIYTEKKNPLEYDLIPTADRNYFDKRKINTFYKFNFRISDWSVTNIRDAAAQKLAAPMRPDTAESVPTALFLNGQYWGLYECREQLDNKYISTHYDIDSGDVVLLDRDWTMEPRYEVLKDTGTTYVDKIDYSEGPADGTGVLGESYYREQWRYIQSLAVEKDITDPNVYAEFCANVDIDNFIDYLIVYIYSANDDWPGNNFKFWRVTEEKKNSGVYGADGKWRFLIHDFDIAFENVNHKTLELSALYKGAVTESRHPEFATRLLGNLLKNEAFRNELAQRTLVYASTYLSGDVFKALTESLSADRRDGKYADLMRWNLGTFQNRLSWWDDRLNEFAAFGNGRRQAVINQYTSVLNNNYSAGIKGTSNVEADSLFDFEVNGAPLKAGTYSLKLFSGIPVRIDSEGACITVSDGVKSVRYEDSAKFILENGKSYDVSVQKKAVNITYDGNLVRFTSGEEARGILAYYNEEGALEKVTSQKFAGTYEVSPENDGSLIKAMLWNKTEPLCKSLILKGTAKKTVMLARRERFLKMSVGEKLPAVVFDSIGQRADFEAWFEGSCAAYENGFVTALEKGNGVLRVKVFGQEITAEVSVE